MCLEGWLWEGGMSLWLSSCVAPLDRGWQPSWKLEVFPFVAFVPPSVISETCLQQDGWHIVGTEQRHGIETKPPWGGRHTYAACGCSVQLLFDGLACSPPAPLPKRGCHTAGSTYCTCGKVCGSLVGTVCFSPVLVMFLLGCGKNICRDCRDNGGMWLVKDWPQPIIS